MTGIEFRELRKQLQLTQKDFADALGIHRITAAKFEAGTYPIPKAIEMAARYLAGERLGRFAAPAGGSVRRLIWR